MKQEKTSSYHHGDLRQAILDCAQSLLLIEGEEAITLRGIAKSLDVSRSAPYRHFKDKQALMAALASLGFARQIATFEQFLAELSTADPQQAFMQLGRAYIHFAQQQPEFYQLMFSSPNIKLDQDPQLCEVSKRSFEILLEQIAQLYSQKLEQAELLERGNFVWAAIHGYCCLIQARPAPKTELMQQQQERFLSRIVKGLAVQA